MIDPPAATYGGGARPFKRFRRIFSIPLDTFITSVIIPITTAVVIQE